MVPIENKHRIEDKEPPKRDTNIYYFAVYYQKHACSKLWLARCYQDRRAAVQSLGAHIEPKIEPKYFIAKVVRSDVVGDNWKPIKILIVENGEFFVSSFIVQAAHLVRDERL
jgi:hypothetical protein